jgi:hypothetical protein
VAGVSEGEASGAEGQFPDVEVGDVSGQLPPWLVEAGEIVDEGDVELGDPRLQWPHPRARQLAACGGDRCAGAQVVEYVAQCGGALHEVVDRAEHGGVGSGRDGTWHAIQ